MINRYHNANKHYLKEKVQLYQYVQYSDFTTARCSKYLKFKYYTSKSKNSNRICI